MLAAEREEMEQELALQLWRSLPAYDPTLASTQTFASRVIDNKAANLGDRLRAKKRTPRAKPEPKDREQEVREVVDRSDMLAAERDRQEEEDLRLDVQRIVDRLPSPQQRLCRLLLATGCITDAAKAAGVPRTTFLGQLAPLRRLFERKELTAYLRSDAFRSSPVRPTRRKE